MQNKFLKNYIAVKWMVYASKQKGIFTISLKVWGAHLISPPKKVFRNQNCPLKKHFNPNFLYYLGELVNFKLFLFLPFPSAGHDPPLSVWREQPHVRLDQHGGPGRVGDAPTHVPERVRRNIRLFLFFLGNVIFHLFSSVAAAPTSSRWWSRSCSCRVRRKRQYWIFLRNSRIQHYCT